MSLALAPSPLLDLLPELRPQILLEKGCIAQLLRTVCKDMANWSDDDKIPSEHTWHKWLGYHYDLPSLYKEPSKKWAYAQARGSINGNRPRNVSFLYLALQPLCHSGPMLGSKAAYLARHEIFAILDPLIGRENPYYSIVEAATYSGDVSFVQMLHDRGWSFDWHGPYMAAQEADMAMLELFHTLGVDFGNAFWAAAVCRHMTILEWLIAHKHTTYQPPYDWHEGRCQLEMLKLLSKHGLWHITPLSYHSALEARNLPLLRYLLQTKPLLRPTRVRAGALGRPSYWTLEVLEELQALVPIQWKWSRRLRYAAAPVRAWLYERLEPCEAAFRSLIERKDTATMDVTITRQWPFYPGMYALARGPGRMDVLAWLEQHGYPDI